MVLMEPFLQVLLSSRGKELGVSLRSTGLVMKAIQPDEAEGKTPLCGSVRTSVFSYLFSVIGILEQVFEEAEVTSFKRICLKLLNTC